MLFLAVLAGRGLIIRTPDRQELGRRDAAVRFAPVDLDASGFAPLRLAGAWTVSVADPRFGGISALALDGRHLLVLSDAGVIARLPRPGMSGRAEINELPDGPGDPAFKRYRDSEALLRAHDGSGWWVAFENRHSLWKYDASFGRVLTRVPLSHRGWGVNKGVEGAAASGCRLLLFPEAGQDIVAIGRNGAVRLPLANPLGRISDATTLPDGRIMVVLRQPTLTGFRNAVAWLGKTGSGYRVDRRITLPVGPLHNIEALAAESAGNGTRLWLMSDNNFHRAQGTLLLALDVPAAL